MDSTCCTHGENRNACSKSQKQRDHQEDLDVSERIFLKRILEIKDGVVLTG